MIKLDQVRESLPANFKNNITQGMVDKLNNLSTDVEEARYMADNFVSFSTILNEGKYKMGDYVRAIMYTTHKIMGKSNLDSYRLTFPERYDRMVQSGKATKDIASIVSIYNKGILVSKIMEQALVPSWILNQHMFQDALNVQYEIMNDVDESGRNRIEAANSLLTHLKRPESVKTELKVDIQMNDGMVALENSLSQLAERQLNAIEHDPDTNAKSIAHGSMMKSVN